VEEHQRNVQIHTIPETVPTTILFSHLCLDDL
jgi:hypothetical protein